MTAMANHHSYMKQYYSLFTLISYYAIVFAFALNVHWWLVYLVSNGFVILLSCLLAESFETTNHYQLSKLPNACYPMWFLRKNTGTKSVKKICISYRCWCTV